MAYLTVLNSLLAAAFLPLGAFFVLLFWGRRIGRQGNSAGGVGLAVAVASFGLSLAALVIWVDKEGFNKPNYVEAFTYRWIQLPAGPPVAAPAGMGVPAPALPRPPDGVTIGCLVDSLTIAMFMVLTLLNVLVHVFALGSLAGHPNRPWFMAWLAFFNFALLGLLLANSLPQVLVFWELLSLGAYFLIRLASPQEGPVAVAASLRMYVMNGVGAAAFVLGMGILVLHTHSLAGLAFFDDHGVSILSAAVRQAIDVQSSEFLFFRGGVGFMQMHWLTWAGICFLVAALARMAQFPFFTWLHDVAEAPAAVAALLAAATLAAGVFLLARVYPILTLDARFIAAVLGSVTLAAGAAVALVQTDLRKILAWSTVSQGGYVLLFLGAGGYEAGILHLFTHGFAKTALFLAAGAVVQGLGTADIRQMGGLWKRFPITAFGSLLAILALGGAPWLSGSYSTDLGLACVYDYAHALQGVGGRHLALLLFHVPAACTYVTALGIGRWWWLAFAGANRNPKLFDAAHESAFLTLPILLLAGFLFGGLYDFAGIVKLIDKSIPAILLAAGPGARPLVLTGSELAGALVISELARALVIRQTAWAFLGLGAAVFIHLDGMGFSKRLRGLPGVNVMDYWLRERMFFDELFEGALMPALRLLARVTSVVEWLGRALGRVVAGAVGLLAGLVARLEGLTGQPASVEGADDAIEAIGADEAAGESPSPSPPPGPPRVPHPFPLPVPPQLPRHLDHAQWHR